MRLYSLPIKTTSAHAQSWRIRSDHTTRGSSGHRPAGHRSPRRRPAGNERAELFPEHRRSAPEMPAKINAAWFRVAGEGTVRAVSWLWRRGSQFVVRFLPTRQELSQARFDLRLVRGLVPCLPTRVVQAQAPLPIHAQGYAQDRTGIHRRDRAGRGAPYGRNGFVIE